MINRFYEYDDEYVKIEYQGYFIFLGKKMNRNG